MSATTFLALGAHGWGKGETPKAAIRKMRSHMSPPTEGRETEGVLLETPPDAWVDDMGYVHWESGDVTEVNRLRIHRKNGRTYVKRLPPETVEEASTEAAEAALEAGASDAEIERAAKEAAEAKLEGL